MDKMYYKIQTKEITKLADTVTPVSLYLKLRDRFSHCMLLESSDYHGQENSFSYLCFDPIASFILEADGTLVQSFPDGTSSKTSLNSGTPTYAKALQSFKDQFDAEKKFEKGLINGLFGFTSYEAVEFMENLSMNKEKKGVADIPLADYRIFRFIIALDHFRNRLHILENAVDGNFEEGKLEEVISLIDNKNVPDYAFEAVGEEQSNYTDKEYREIVEKGISHCKRGDVFQIVLSRRFQTAFEGDEFNVYRSLRSLNPSPYLFYFDYGSFKIFGSSPEAQIVVQNGKASIFPIAGTFRRTGNDEADAELARKLLSDPKENSEHVMLVDLARNDLSRHSEEVTVETFREIQYYSHVIHLVSKVSGKLQANASSVQLMADTFPAGTLSGAPKHMAMTLIDQYETSRRGYYGGAIGMIGFDGSINQAIMIRSFLSKDNNLYCQAGAGVVAKSDPDSEVQEVYNKLAALKQAIKEANRNNS
ncbi:anthranilate synthase component I family protein [Fulvivirgaceae bacterium LMO-SS25]